MLRRALDLKRYSSFSLPLLEACLFSQKSKAESPASELAQLVNEASPIGSTTTCTTVFISKSLFRDMVHQDISLLLTAKYVLPTF